MATDEKRKLRGIRYLILWLGVFAFWLPNLFSFRDRRTVNVLGLEFYDAFALTALSVLTLASVTLFALGLRDLLASQRD